MSQGLLFSRVLLTGPAGCGKTHRVLEIFRREIVAGREEDVLLLSPTTSFREHTRNTLLRSGEIRAFSGRSVATFSDLGLDVEATLTSARQELLARRLLQEMKAAAFADVAKFPGFRRTLVEEAEEAIAAGLAAASEFPRRREAFSQFLRRYEAATAPFRPVAQPVARPSILLVDGFTDFTPRQQQVVATLVEGAGSAIVTLPPDCEPAADFLVKRLGFQVETMTGNHRTRSTLATLEGASCRSTLTRHEEVEMVARRVQELIREGYRYQEIGVIVRNAEAYLALIADIFRHHRIPARFFFPVTIPETALGRHLLACLKLFPSPSPEDVMSVLKSPYSPVVAEFFDKLAAIEQQRAGARSVAEMARWVRHLWSTLTLPREIPPGLPHDLALDLRADAQAEKEARAVTEEITEAAEAERAGLDFATFAALLDSELRRRQFHVRDRRADVVNVMNPFEARQWELRAVFVVGLVEKEFPRPRQRPLFLHPEKDNEREEARLFYAATTRARDRLFLSYSSMDDRGVPLLPSLFLEGAPAAQPEEDPVEVEAPAPPAAPARLTLPASLARLREREVSYSASRFANFAHCPFQHFAQYLLRLGEEPEGLDFRMQGGIIHKTLHDWESEGRARPIEEVFDKVFDAETAKISLHHVEEQIRSRMLEDLKRVVGVEALHDRDYRTTVDRSLLEKGFGGRDEKDILEWTLADGAKIQLRGRLDRVETVQDGSKRLGLVVDYKYSKNGFQEKLLERGESQGIQIPMYLLALDESFGIEPAGAELYTLRDEPQRSGLINAAYANLLYRSSPPKKSLVLRPAEFRALLEKSREQMKEFAQEIRAGEIRVDPHKTDRCRKGKCDFYDLCRTEKA